MSRTRRTALLSSAALAVALLVTPPGPAGADARAGGALDPTYSPDAPAGITDVLAGHAFVDEALQQDGKVVAISNGTGDFVVTRYNTDGSLDTGFGSNGTGSVSVDVGGAGQVDNAFAVAVDPQNRIVVVGGGGASVSDFALVRLAADGRSYDINTHNHFGTAGKSEAARDVAFESDGTIVVVGGATLGNHVGLATALFRGSDGAVTRGGISVPGGVDAVNLGVAVYPSGPDKDRFVVVGVTDSSTTTGAIQVQQSTADGNPDTSFGGAGSKTFDPTTGPDVPSGVAITSTGSVLVSGTNGTADRDPLVLQLLPTGQFDPAFGGAVRTLVRTGSEVAPFHGLALAPDGRIALAANAAASGPRIYRLNADGSPDTTFGTSGVTTLDPGALGEVDAVTVDPAGRVLLAGSAGGGGVVARLQGPDTDGDGVRDVADACPTIPGTLPNGCPPAASPPPPPPATAHDAVLKGRKVVLDTVLSTRSASARCPKAASVKIKTKAAHSVLRLTTELRATSVTTGCRVHGKVRLPARPAATAPVKVTVKGKALTTEHLLAVRP